MFTSFRKRFFKIIFIFSKRIKILFSYINNFYDFKFHKIFISINKDKTKAYTHLKFKNDDHCVSNKIGKNFDK
jgi:hypothetical protein